MYYILVHDVQECPQKLFKIINHASYNSAIWSKSEMDLYFGTWTLLPCVVPMRAFNMHSFFPNSKKYLRFIILFFFNSGGQELKILNPRLPTCGYEVQFPSI